MSLKKRVSDTYMRCLGHVPYARSDGRHDAGLCTDGERQSAIHAATALAREAH